MVDAATEFKKSGFSEQDSADLALVASMYQNIADEQISASEAANFLVSQMKAFNLTAEDSQHIIDAVNNVSNNMAVSSADLATNIGKASAALAVGNNTYEESLALMTGIVEITRNGSRAARGLVSVQSRLNQVVDESSSTGKALTQWYQEHNIALYDQEGQLRSLYDVLSDVADIWPDLTTNEKDYYLNQQAGANQTQNLAAALNNFEGVEKAYTLALNSAGSAMKENEAVTESLAFKQNELNASVQELANNLISDKFIGGLLSVANGFLQIDNSLGNLVSRFVLLAGIGWGGSQLLHVTKIIPTVIKQFKTFGTVLTLAGEAGGSFGAALSAAGGAAAVSLPIILALSAAIALVAAGIQGWIQLQEAEFPTADEFNKKLKETNDQLEANKQRLEEINAMPWNERTQEILDEKAALEAENEELRESLDLIEKRSVSAAKVALFGGEGSAAYVKGGTALGGFKPAGDYQADETTVQNTEQAKEYIAVLEQEGQLTDEQNSKYQALLSTMAERAKYYEILANNVDNLTDEEKLQLDGLKAEYDAYNELVDVYDRVVYGQEALANAYKELTSTGYITEQTYQRLIGIYPQLADGAIQTANGYQIQQSALENLMSAEQRQTAQITTLVNGFIEEARQSGATEQALLNLVQAQITASNTGLNFTQQIAALQALAQQAGYTAAYVQNVLSAGLSQSNIERTAKGWMQTGKYKNYQDALAEATRRANQELQRRWGNLTSVAPSGGYSSSFTGGASTVRPSGGGTPSAASNQASQAQAEIKQLQAEQDKIQDQIDAINDKYDQQLKELEDINDELEDQIRLQKLLEDLAEAKSRTKMVFKDGRFQYIQDTDAVSKAQANLDEYYRDKELVAKKKQIEAARQLELAGLQAEKKRLEERIKYWRNFSSDMSGVYNSSLSDLTDYVNNWNAKIDSMKKPSADTSGGGTYDDVVEDPLVYETNKKIAAAYPSADYNTNHNSRYSTAETKELQAWYGTSADGVWGKNSYAAAGNRNISTAWSLYQRVKSRYSSFAAFKAKGGYATGTLSAMSGISMVGEQGPELRVLNKGDGVIPAKQTARLWSFANDPARFLQNIANYRGGMSEIINVQNVTLPNVRNAQDFVAGLRNLAYQRAYAR